jgi:colanic acid biosynthesis glycosyl transferase WcaI
VHIQLWSYNYHPEPTGIAPVSRTLALGLLRLGHEIEVVAAHPHYPEPRWGTAWRPYRSTIDGITVTRLPIWSGRGSAGQRMRQEALFAVTQALAAPFLRTPDIAIVVSPSFPALAPAIAAFRVRSTPWVLWLHDILPDGAESTGLVENGWVLHAARRLERAAYSSAGHVVVLSGRFVENLRRKGVPSDKIELIYDPATRTPIEPIVRRAAADRELRFLLMGNIGHTQGLTPLLAELSAKTLGEEHEWFRLRVCGTGVAAADAKAVVKSSQIEMLGLISTDDLEAELRGADIGIVTQQYAGSEFNIPSKIMNYMAYGLPVLAAVHPAGEVADIISRSSAGWVVDSSDPGSLVAEMRRLNAARDEIALRAEAAKRFAAEHFSAESFARKMERLLVSVLDRHTNSQAQPRNVGAQRRD